MQHYVVIHGSEHLDVAAAIPLADNENGLFEVNEEGKPVRLIGTDGGEPEDKTLTRDLSWVLDALNAVARERDEAWQAKKDAERATATAIEMGTEDRVRANRIVTANTEAFKIMETIVGVGFGSIVERAQRLVDIVHSREAKIDEVVRERQDADERAAAAEVDRDAARRERDQTNDARERDWLRHRAARADARAYLVGVFDIDSGRFLGCDIFSEETPTLGKKFPITLATGGGDDYEAGVIDIHRQLEHPAMSWLKAHMVPRAGRRNA